MPTMLTQDEVSLRHLPEVSDYSFSFQIPTSSIPKGDDLLADTTHGFLDGVDDASLLETPAAGPSSGQLLSSSRILAPGQTMLESSPIFQKQRCQQPASSSLSPNNTYAFTEALQSPITAALISSKDVHQEAEDPPRELQHQEPSLHEQQLRSSESKSTTHASNIASSSSPQSPTTFPEQSSAEPQYAEVNYSRGDPLTAGAHQQPKISTINTNETENEPRTNDKSKSKASRKLRVQPVRSGNLISKEVQRSTAPVTDTVKRTRVSGGIMARKQEKTVGTMGLRSQPKRAARAINSHPVTQKKIAIPHGNNAMDETDDDINLTSSIPDDGVAGRLVMYSQKLTNANGSTSRNTTEPKTLVLEASSLSETETTPQESLQLQDVQMSFDEPSHGFNDINTTNSDIDEVDDRDGPLTLAQLSPRKRSTMQTGVGSKSKVTEVTVQPPTLTVSEPPPSSRSLNKRPFPTSIESQDPPRRKKGKKDSTASFNKDGKTMGRADMINIPLAVENAAASSSSAKPEVGSRISGTAMDNNVEENDGDKEEAYNTETSSKERIVGQVGKMAGSTKDAKRPTGIGTKARTGKASRIVSSSVSGGRTSRKRSSNSVSVKAEILHSSGRERRITRLQVRRSVRQRDKDKGNDVSTNRKIDESGLTNPVESIRPLEFTTSELHAQRRKNVNERMTRSMSSLSSSTGCGSSTSRRLHPIPDFKALHAAQAEERIKLKENIHPVIPQPFQLTMDERLKERKRFDELMKEKEREREIIEEQKRKEREEEEEREIRELRRKAIPKANTVPEWYKNAPKKNYTE